MMRLILIVASAACLASCSLDPFLFNSTKLDAYVLPDSVIPASQREHVQLTVDGVTMHGFFVKQVDSLHGDPPYTIVYHHGNRDHLAYYWPRVELLYRAGFNVFIYDYNGYGMSGGTSTEASFYANARAAWMYVMSRKDVDTSLITNYGYSLGCAAATDVSATVASPHALILEAPFASSESLVRSGTVLDIPGHYLMDGEFANDKKIGAINAPLLILHGTDDVFIPIDPNGKRLYELARNPKTFLPVVGAGHDNIPEVMGHGAYIDLITAFIKGT
jgi:pimeloyl-ACP methyl ester carboxylesterase